MLQRVVQGNDGKLHFGTEDETNIFVAGTALRRHEEKLFSEYSWTTDDPVHDLESRLGVRTGGCSHRLIDIYLLWQIVSQSLGSLWSILSQSSG